MTEVLIEVDDGAMPEGWEPERFGFPEEGETIISAIGQKTITHQVLPSEIYCSPRMILRKKYDPGITCIPKGWWVWFLDTCWVASTGVGICDKTVRGLEFLPDFIPPEDGQPRKIK